MIFQFKIGKPGFELGEVTACDSAFLYENREIVAALVGNVSLVIFLEFAFGAGDLVGNGGKCIPRDCFANILFVGQVLVHKGVQISPGIGWVGTGGLNEED